MTSSEYRKILDTLTLEQRGKICELAGLIYSRPDNIEGMVQMFEDQGSVAEVIVVRWLRRNVPEAQAETEASRVVVATYQAAWYAKASFVAAVALGILSLVLSFCALLK